MNYTEFRDDVRHDGKIQLRVCSHMNIGNSDPFFKDEVLTDTEYLRYANISYLSIMNGKLTGLSDYEFFLVILPNGTTLVLQDLLGRNTDGQDIIEEAVRC